MLTVILIFNVSALSINAKSDEEAKNNVSEVQPMAVTIEFDKPIAYTQYVSNYKLGQMIEEYERGSTWLSIANAILFAGITAPAGVANSIAADLVGDISHLREAYYDGLDMHWVALYASGVEPSLSKEAHVFYTAHPLIFTD